MEAGGNVISCRRDRLGGTAREAANQVICQPICCRGPGGWLRRWASIATTVALTLLIAAASVAREQTDEFVAGLRERGLHELALDYLDQMQSSPLADEAFRGRIDYHRAMIYVDQARRTPDADQRAELFDRARNDLDHFVAANPNNPSGAEALTDLANVFVEQGKVLMAEAAQLPAGAEYAGKRGELSGAARRLFDEAIPRFGQSANFYTAALGKLPKTLDPKTQSDEIQLRQDYRGRLAQASVLGAQAQFEKAATFPRDDPQYRELNEQTAQKLAKLHDEFSRWLVGLYARLYEGRCYQAIGDYQRALGCYDQLIGQSSVHPAFRKLIASAYGYQAECYIDESKFNEAIANCTRWLNDAKEGEAEQPEWLVVRYRLAEAQLGKSKQRDTQGLQRRRLTSDARDNFRVVANSPGELQAAARFAATQLGPSQDTSDEPPRDFKTAYEAGKEAMASVNAARMNLPLAEKNNPAAVPALRMQMQEGTENARKSFQQALLLVDDDTDVAQLNEVRYFLCWLHWDNGDYHQAAVLGDFLARRYPDHAAAAAAAKLALASYERLQQTPAPNSTSAEDADFEARKMAEVAEFITRRWPQSQAAETAFRVLASYAIRHNRIDDAKKLLGEVAESSRPVLEAQLGNAMWSRYLELTQKDPAAKDDPATEQLRVDALTYLHNGYDAARKSGRMSEVAATAGLYLVQASLNDGDYSEAIKLLEDPKFGPLALIEKKNEVVGRPEYQMEVFRSALRAYVSATPPRAEKAIDTMKRLEQAASAAGVSADQLTRVYVSLAMSLDEQIKSLRKAGRDEEADRVSAAFAEFLKQIAARPAGGDWPIRNWVAQTYFTMGESLRTPNAPLPRQAKVYLTAARDAYQGLLAEAEQNPEFAPSADAVLVARRQLGECYRDLGEYKLALDTFSDVLKDREAQLTVQQEAAQTYQDWGAASSPKWLERAIYGGYQVRATGKNRIWGWLKLALVAERAARSNPAYSDVFFDARLQAARCRYLVGRKTQGATREQHFATAKQSIRSMLALYPDLGGSEWRGKFESLLKQIQQADGAQPVGLQEFAAAVP
jgi:tetratricopeptide (TPR) repeat protein